MVADPDEWDDQPHPGTGKSTEDRTAQGLWYNTFITTNPIDLSGVAANSLVLVFASSWRPEYDSNYRQTGLLDAIWDDGTPQRILHWVSLNTAEPWEPGITTPAYKDDNSTNDEIVLPLNNPAGAGNLKFKFGMIDASDDGFQVTAGTANAPTYLVLGAFDAGRGAADSVFYFNIQQAGVYFFRLLWFEGTGGASVEWFTINADGSAALVNGAQTGAIRAYRTRTVAEPQLPPMETRFNAPTLANGQVTLSWTGGGTLQEGTDWVSWTNSANQTNPQTVAPTGALKVYRIRVSP